MKRLTMLKNSSHTQMMCFVIEADGAVIAIDGGNTDDAGHLLETLQRITGQKRPQVDAWIITHPHNDHMDAFLTLAGRGLVEFDRLLINFPSGQYMRREEHDGPRCIEWFFTIADKFANKIVPVSTDDVYKFGSAEFKVLYTVDDTIKNNVVNNASVVYKMTLGGKTTLFLGDLGEEGGDKLLAAKRDELKSDLCQMAHHGQNGVKRDFYEAVSPEVCLWCAPDWLWDNDVGKGFDTHFFKTVKVRRWMEEIGAAKNLVIKDGDQIWEY